MADKNLFEKIEHTSVGSEYANPTAKKTSTVKIRTSKEKKVVSGIILLSFSREGAIC